MNTDVIADEREFMTFAAERARLEERILRLRRHPAGELAALLTGESLSLDDIEAMRSSIQEAMDGYDQRVNRDRRGPGLLVCRHHRFWPNDPRPGDFDIRDIALSLSRICRFNGHVRVRHYSVGQHSVLTSRILPSKYRLRGLLHDVSEGYIHDIISPVKRLIRDAYDPLEESIMRAAFTQFGIDYDDNEGKALVKWADEVMLATEARDVSALGYVAQPLKELPLETPIIDCWSQEEAEHRFLEEFRSLAA